MIRNTLKRLGSFLLEIGNPPPEPVGRGGAGGQRATAIDERLRRRISAKGKGRPQVLAANIQLLGLAQLEELLGEMWTRVNEKALDVTEAAIERNRGPKDEYQRYNDDTFVLIFGEADKLAAEQRARLITDEVRELLLAEVPEADLRVEHRLEEVDCTESVASGTSIFEAVARRLQEISTEVRETYEQLRRELLQNARVVYSPIWNPKKRAVLMYRCLLDRVSGQTTLQKMRDLGSIQDLQRVLFDIDCLMLGRVLEQVHALLQKQGKAVFLVPLHFQTLREKGPREEYTALCRAIPSAYAPFIMLEVHSLPEDVLIDRVLELTRQLRPHASGVVLRTDAAPEQLPQIASSGIFGLSTDLNAASAAPERLVEHLTELVQLARGLRLRMIAHDANSIRLAEVSHQSGFDYVDGEAIAPKMECPRSMYRWNPH